MKSKFLPLMLAVALQCFATTAADAAKPVKSSVQNYINETMKSDRLWKNAVIAIKAIDDKGKVIAEWNPDFPILTASTMKTVTTGAGLFYLGEDFRFETKVAYTGTINNGTLQGDLFIIGGGDPTLGSADTVAFPIDSIFGVWRDAVANAGINKVNGNIVVDDSFFKREIPASWCWSDIAYDYGCAPSGLTFYENTTKFKLTPGAVPGSKANVEVEYPLLPTLSIENSVVTGEPNSGNNNSYRTQDLSLSGRFYGSIPVNREVIYETNSNKFPHLSCGYEFERFLEKSGINVNGTVEDIQAYDKRMAANPASAVAAPAVIATTYSPELWKIVLITNRISNNLYAETILKMIDKKLTGNGSYYSALSSIRTILKDSIGVDLWGFRNDDGSGLSRENYVAPNFFCNYYTTMAKSGIFAKFFESLPIPGRPGTLRSVLKNEKEELKSRIHAKSGSLSSVKCYAGYVEMGDSQKREASEKRLIKFAILTNNFDARAAEMMPKIEGFMKALAQYAEKH